MSSIYVGLDLGTTSVKAVAFTHEGEVLGEILREYPLKHPKPGAAVQDPDTVIMAAEEVLIALIQELDEQPAGIGISTAMHSLVLLDRDHQPISPIITWADTRAVDVLEEFTQEQRLALLKRTGTPVHPMAPLLKIKWLRQADPQLWSRVAYCSDLKSLLMHRWTEDGLLIDTNLASATGLYDLQSGAWDDKALSIAGIEPGQLPKIVPPTYVAQWKAKVAQRLGTNNSPLVIGGSDGCLANLGSGLEKGEVALTVGTSGAVRTTHTQVVIDPEAGLFNYHLIDDQYVIGGATNNGGKLLDWLFNWMQHDYQNIGEMIEAAATADCEGLVFQPYLYGERAPIYDPRATAGFSGMRGHHQPAQYARAVLQGLTNNLVEILRKLEKITGEADRIIVSGGLTRSAFWLSLLEELSAREVQIADTAQASAYGAALMARKALEEY